MDERIEAVISGRVQVVMFRDFTCRSAKSFGLVGEVRNQSDGTVQIIAEGKRDTLDKFLEHLRRGSLLSKVEDITVIRKPVTGTHKSFVLKYD